MTPRPSRSDAGFSLPEVLIAMGIMLVVLAGTFSAMANAMQAEQTARSITTMNGYLRGALRHPPSIVFLDLSLANLVAILLTAAFAARFRDELEDIEVQNHAKADALASLVER